MDSTSVADGLDHQLDPRSIIVNRIGGALVAALVAVGSFIGLTIGLVAGDWPAWLGLLVFGAWMAQAVIGAWYAFRWPPLAWQHSFYRVDAQGIEIRRGVYWRVVVNVPRSRVQHIDVSQNPIEHRFGLGTLVVYTAGTDHAKVALSGLEHGLALQLREHLLPSGGSDAV
jgi:membrane protein YdbS with pleckstrin-like domain